MSIVDDLIAAGRALVDAGLSPGTSGNLSVHDGNRVIMTGTGAALGRLTPDMLSFVTLDGGSIEGARPSKELPLHLALYARDRANRAVVHVHPPETVAVSCLEPWSAQSAIPPLTPYFVMKVGQTPLLPYRHPGDPALGDDIRDVALPIRAALLSNHGSVVTGTDIAEAVNRAIELEAACRIALATNGKARRELTEAQAVELAAEWGSPWTPQTQTGQ